MSNHFFSKIIVLSIFLLGLFSSSRSQSSVPTDLRIIGSAGGGNPSDEQRLLQIAADGQGLYLRYLPGSPLDPPLEEHAFTLTQAEVADIWQAIENNDFFNMESAYTDTLTSGGSSIRFSILAHGTIHEVYAQNQVVAALDSIVSVINRVTPGTNDLIYDPAIVPTIIPEDPCESTFRDRVSQHDPELLRKISTSDEIDMPKVQVFKEFCDYHPGSVVACRMSIYDAVQSGIATLEAKHEFNGDAVAITIDANKPIQCNKLNVKLYLEFYGPTATPENVQRIKSAIENYWNSMPASDGRLLNVEVETLLHAGELTIPGSKGYHQIQLKENIRSYVKDGRVNSGTGRGIWKTSGATADQIFAHEAGHLMGLPDRYTDYVKQIDGRWRNAINGQRLTNEEMANVWNNGFSGLSQEKKNQLLQRTINDPVGMLRSVPNPTQGDDIMATIGSDARVRQVDVDEIATKNVGIFIDIPPGTPLVPKNGAQNLIATRLIEMFVPMGETKTCGGLYASCIDADKKIPTRGEALDLGPSLDTWPNIEAASLLFKLVRYIDENNLYCGDYDALHAIWRITDNKDIGKANVDGFLQNAGIPLGKELLDFPRMSNPDSTNPNTSFVIPPQLYSPKVTPTATLTQVGSAVELTGSITKLSVIDSSAHFGWSLVTPDSSRAKLVDPKSDHLAFTPDVRGAYFPALSVTTQKNGRAPSTVFVPVKERVVAADAQTETFESGNLRSGGPFYWATSPDAPWRVTDSSSYSGKFAVQGMLGSDIFTSTSELTVKFFLPDSDQISFAYWVPSDGGTLEFYINSHSEPTAGWRKERGWNYVSFALAAGENTLTWFYWHLNRSIEVVWLDDIFFPQRARFIPTSVEHKASPLEYNLLQNYPNPFNNETAIHFSIPTPQMVTLTVYDILGQQVQVLVNERKSAGRQIAHFNTSGLAGGTYFYRLTAGPFRAVKSMVVLK